VVWWKRDGIDDVFELCAIMASGCETVDHWRCCGLLHMMARVARVDCTGYVQVVDATSDMRLYVVR
jgi:hypothetical protein